MINDKVDFTYLKPYGSKEDVIKFLEEAKKYNPYAVCLFPKWTGLANWYLSQTNIKIVNPLDHNIIVYNLISNLNTKEMVFLLIRIVYNCLKLH